MKNPVVPITDRIKKIQQKLTELKKLVENAEENSANSPKKLELIS